MAVSLSLLCKPDLYLDFDFDFQFFKTIDSVEFFLPACDGVTQSEVLNCCRIEDVPTRCKRLGLIWKGRIMICGPNWMDRCQCMRMRQRLTIKTQALSNILAPIWAPALLSKVDMSPVQ